MTAADSIAVYLEIGAKNTFAGSIDWPGWCRGGRGEAAALQALFDYAPRYQKAMQTQDIFFALPTDPSAFSVVERLPGNPTTDFGAPDVLIPGDSRPVSEDELAHLQKLMKACWQRFSQIGQATGPRRSLLPPARSSLRRWHSLLPPRRCFLR
jgi:hypothetical protein